MKKGFLLSVAFFYSTSVQAYEYIFEPVFNSSERYESNLFMQPTPRQGNWISTLSPALNFGLRHETGELNSTLTWNQLLYNNQSELDRAEQLFSSRYQHQFQRFNWSLGGGYNNQSSLNSETTPAGILSTQVTSKNISLSPSVSYTLDELNTLSVNYAYSKATYSKTTANIFLSDYTNQQVSSSLSHVYSQRDSYNVSISGTLYETQPQFVIIPRQTTYNYVTQLGWQHRFSEQLSTSLSGGINYSQFESTQQIPAFFSGIQFVPASTVTTQQNNFGMVFSASITKSFERSSISFSGSQNQSPSAVGTQTQQQLSINTSYMIDDRWSSALSASYNKSDITGQSNSSFNRTYYSLNPNINWKCSPEINLGLSYTYRQQEFLNSNTQSSLGNTVQLNFSYQPKLNLR